MKNRDKTSSKGWVNLTVKTSKSSLECGRIRMR